MWFNPGELSKDKTVPLANSANPANYEPESHKKTPLISKLAELAVVEWLKLPDPTPGALMVICYTPAGNAVEVEAKNPEHAAFLQRMNPPQR